MSARAPDRTAGVTPSYGMRAVGGFGIRGWRVFCPDCGHLSKLYTNYHSVSRASEKHRCGKADS